MPDETKRENGEWSHVERVERVWAFIPESIAYLIGYCPQYRDTKSGRQKATQIRAVLLFVGISIIVFAQTKFLAIGMVLCAMAIVIPMLESRKRNVIRYLKRLKSTEKIKTTSVDFHIDQTHFETNLDDEKFRGKRKAVKVERGPTGRQVAQFKHTSKKTKIWIRSADDADDETEIVDRSRMTDIVDVDARTFALLRGN